MMMDECPVIGRNTAITSLLHLAKEQIPDRLIPKPLNNLAPPMPFELFLRVFSPPFFYAFYPPGNIEIPVSITIVIQFVPICTNTST